VAHTARQEPLGRVLLESAASAKAVVATDVGGTREIFPPTIEAAHLVPPDNADTLAAAIVDLLGDRPRRTRLGNAARRRAEEVFPVSRAIARLIEHYRAVSRA
jgi:glycosyltransferase involved in cell wall biosynthesis